MAQVITGGMDTFDTLAFPQTNLNIMPFLERQMDNFTSSVHNGASVFYDKAVTMFKAATDSSAMRKARAIQRKVRGMWDVDEIRPLWDVGEVQQAKLKMQRWVMACPEIRTLYHKQQCDGYSDTYVDVHPTDIGEDHYDYRRVMDGVFVDHGEGHMVATSYLDEVEPDDILDIDQQNDILQAWSTVRIAVEKGEEDPTSPLNDVLA